MKHGVIGWTLALIVSLPTLGTAQIAGEISIHEGMAAAFADIDNAAFKCSLLPPIKSFLQGIKGKGTLAARVSQRESISIDKEAGLPIWTILKATDGNVRTFVPGYVTMKLAVNAGAVLRAGGYEIKAAHPVKAGDRILVLYIQSGQDPGVALLSSEVSAGIPAFSAFSSDTKNRDATISAWRSVAGGRGGNALTSEVRSAPHKDADVPCRKVTPSQITEPRQFLPDDTDPIVRRAREVLANVTKQVSSGALPKSRLETAQDDLQNALDLSVLKQSLYGPDNQPKDFDQLIAVANRIVVRWQHTLTQAQVEGDEYYVERAKQELAVSQSRVNLITEEAETAGARAALGACASSVTLAQSRSTNQSMTVQEKASTKQPAARPGQPVKRIPTAKLIVDIPSSSGNFASQLPIAETATRFLAGKGYTVIGASDEASSDLTVRITAETDATGRNFASFPSQDYRYTEAKVSGSIVAESRGSSATLQFSGADQENLILLSRDNRFSSPSQAPYMEAFLKSNFDLALSLAVGQLDSSHVVPVGGGNAQTSGVGSNSRNAAATPPLSKMRAAVATDTLVKVVDLGDMGALRARLSAGANPNQPDDSVVGGWTPLMQAAYSGNVDAARLLLQSGATIDARTQFGKSALDIAVSSGDGSRTVADLLRSRGGK